MRRGATGNRKAGGRWQLLMWSSGCERLDAKASFATLSAFSLLVNSYDVRTNAPSAHLERHKRKAFPCFSPSAFLPDAPLNARKAPSPTLAMVPNPSRAVWALLTFLGAPLLLLLAAPTLYDDVAPSSQPVTPDDLHHAMCRRQHLQCASEAEVNMTGCTFNHWNISIARLCSADCPCMVSGRRGCVGGVCFRRDHGQPDTRLFSIHESTDMSRRQKVRHGERSRRFRLRESGPRAGGQRYMQGRAVPTVAKQGNGPGLHEPKRDGRPSTTCAEETAGKRSPIVVRVQDPLSRRERNRGGKRMHTHRDARGNEPVRLRLWMHGESFRPNCRKR